MALRKQRRSMSQINVVPYIDVMLVLLIIFMVTAPLMHTAVVDMPTVQNASDTPADPLRITITSRLEITLLVANKEQTVAEADLIATIKQHLANESRPVLIAADRAVPYGKVMEIADTIRNIPVARVGLLVAQDAQP